MTDHTVTLTDDDAALTVAALLAHAMDLRQAAHRHGWHPNNHPCTPDKLCWGCRQRAELTTKADRCQHVAIDIARLVLCPGTGRKPPKHRLPSASGAASLTAIEDAS